MAKSLEQLRSYAAALENALAESTADGALTVTIDGRSVTRFSPRQLRAELNSVKMQINERESGGAFPFDHSITVSRDTE